MLRFDQWLSVQTLYDDQQVKQMRSKFATTAKGTAAANRKQFIKDTEAKLDILYSPSTSQLECISPSTWRSRAGVFEEVTPAIARYREPESGATQGAAVALRSALSGKCRRTPDLPANAADAHRGE